MVFTWRSIAFLLNWHNRWFPVPHLSKEISELRCEHFTTILEEEWQYSIWSGCLVYSKKTYISDQFHFQWRTGINPHGFVCKHNWNAHWGCGPNARQLHRRRFWIWISVASDSSITPVVLNFRGPIFIISRQGLRPFMTTSAYFISLHFPTHQCSLSFLKLVIIWRNTNIRFPYMFHRVGQICPHLIVQMKLEMVTVFRIYKESNTVWLGLWYAEHLWSAPSVHLERGHSVETAIPLRVPMGIAVGDYRM